MTSPTIEQRQLAIKAIGGTRELFAIKAGLTDPTVGKWLKGNAICAESERKILDTINLEGWRFYSGGLVKASRRSPDGTSNTPSSSN